MNKKDLMVATSDAQLALSKATVTALDAASEYCSCVGEVYSASDKDTREANFDCYVDAMQVLSAIKDIAKETAVITGD